MIKKRLSMFLTIAVACVCSCCRSKDEIFYPIEEVKLQVEKNNNERIQNETSLFIDSEIQVDYEKYYGEVIAFDSEDNEFAELIESNEEKISVVLDLDCDGLNEAIVCVISGSGRVSDLFGLEYDEDEYYILDSMYFIDENKSVELIDKNTRADYLKKTQYLLKQDKEEYVTLNGYTGADPVGDIISSRNNELVFVTDSVDYTGHKYFKDKNTLIWQNFNYNSTIVPIEGKPLIEGENYGKCYYSYYYRIRNFDLLAINAEEKTVIEINDMAPIDIEKYDDCESVQLIYREDGELDINYATKFESEEEYYEIGFNCDIYYFINGNWEYKRTVNGFMNVDPMKKSDWQYLYSN